MQVLGTEHRVRVCEYGAPYFKNSKYGGYINSILKEIVILDLRTAPDYENNNDYCIKEMTAILRHEVIHAFLNESGLHNSSLKFDGAWAKNEEMIDWFSLMIDKIHCAIGCGVEEMLQEMSDKLE